METCYTGWTVKHLHENWHQEHGGMRSYTETKNQLHAAGHVTRAIHQIITEGLLLAGVKKSGIVVHSWRHSTPTFALLNDAIPTRVQKTMRHQHYATMEIYVEEVKNCSRERKKPSRNFRISTPSSFNASSIGPYGLPPLSWLRPSSGIALA